MAFRNRVRNPRLQARIFLPKWYVKIVRPGKDIAEDTVQLHVPLDMGKIDIRNYMKKIYGVPVAKVQTRIQAGKIKTFRFNNDIVTKKTPDIKVAYVMLAEGSFKFPDIFPKATVLEAKDDEVDETKEKRPEDHLQRWFNQ